MIKAYWILAILVMSLLLIGAIWDLLLKIKYSKINRKTEDTIVINLELDTTEFEKKLKKVSKETEKATKKVRKPRTKKTDLQK